MATSIEGSQLDWECQVDDEGHRTYKISWLIRADTTDGPANVLRTPGLPIAGSVWQLDSDVDVWAFCRPLATVKRHPDYKKGERARFWVVEQTFSTKPPSIERRRCQDVQIEDPLLEPPKVSGTFVKYTEEATHDRNGLPILTSSHEVVRGPGVEFDANRPQIKIEQNVAVLDLATFSQMIDTVNDAPLWGLPARTIKLSNVSWSRAFYGVCSVYYTRTLEFDIRYDTFDRDLLDEGTKVLSGHWDNTTGRWTDDNIGGAAPDPDNPAHFIRFKDKNGENARVVLDGDGRPVDADIAGTGTTSGPGTIHVEKYAESNFLVLGIPLVF